MFMEPDEILDVAVAAPNWVARKRFSRSATGPKTAGTKRGSGSTSAARLDAGLRPCDGDPSARGDRAAAAPESRRDELVGALAAQARRAVDGDDAGDHVSSAVRDQRAGPLRQP